MFRFCKDTEPDRDLEEAFEDVDDAVIHKYKTEEDLDAAVAIRVRI